MSTTISIRPATPSDAASLATLAAQTFTETFAPIPGTPTQTNNPQDLQSYIATNCTPTQLTNDIRTHTIFLAFHESTLAGYTVLSQDATEPCLTSSTPRAEIRKLYILQDFKGKGIGKRLWEILVATARERACKSLWLGVWEHNEAAKGFYAKRGMKRCGEHVFLFGEDPQVDEIWEMEL
ncbi:acyl-CoA N-acyltransferase [Phlyctochytrium arcticum]|nr:acyl-CoA N-acyltransferase [Phlyctochytrium arcticum]